MGGGDLWRDSDKQSEKIRKTIDCIEVNDTGYTALLMPLYTRN